MFVTRFLFGSYRDEEKYDTPTPTAVNSACSPAKSLPLPMPLPIASSLQPLPLCNYQWRTFDAIYRFKVKRQVFLTIKMYNNEKKLITRWTFSPEDLGKKSFKNLFSQKHRSATFRTLHKKGNFPLLVPSPITKQECLVELEKAIEELKDLVCKASKQQSQDLPRQAQVPTFALFQKDNPKLAKSRLEAGNRCKREKKYNKALKYYIAALKYTKSCATYAAIPSLLREMGEGDKAFLATLYLIKYQLEKRESAQAALCSIPLSALSLTTALLFTKLYQLQNQLAYAVEAAKNCISFLEKKDPKQALLLYRHILLYSPKTLSFYQPLAALTAAPCERRAILLKGACHALDANNSKVAQKLFESAFPYLYLSWIDQQIKLTWLNSQEQKRELIRELLQFTAYASKEDLFYLALKGYKMLYELKKTSLYCQKIVLNYEKLNKREKQIPHYHTWISMLIKEKNWIEAKRVAEKALRGRAEIARIPFYEYLEVIYANLKGQNSKLKDLLPKLGKAYLNHNRIKAAEMVYNKACKQFPTFNAAFSLAEMLRSQKKIKKSVRAYYKASEQALLDQQPGHSLQTCIEKIRSIDPSMRFLDKSQQLYLLTQMRIFTLSEELQSTRKELYSLKKRADPLEKITFEKDDWETRFGPIGKVPPPPKGIKEILHSNCPFWPGQKVYETHLFVLIPKIVQGKPFTLNFLNELITNARGEKSGASYRYYKECVETELGEREVYQPYWVLMTKQIIPGSRNQSYENQCQLIRDHQKKFHLSYKIPSLIEATTAILTHYIKTKESLYTDDQLGRQMTYTRCREKILKNKWPVVVGGLSSSGLAINDNSDDDDCGVAGVRYF